MAKPHPSIVLIFDIDESLDSPETRLELKRCYNYVSSTTSIRTHATDEEVGVQNTLRVLVKFGARQYLHSSDEGADELWNDILEHHLLNDFEKLANNMQIYNRRQREEDNDEVYFDWLEVELQGGELNVRFHLDSESSLPAERATMVTQVRSLLNAGKLGEGVTRVSIPSLSSYVQQKAAYDAEEEERALQAAAEEEARRKAEEEARAAAEAAAEENFLESPELEAELDEETKYHLEEAEVIGQVRARYTLAEPDFVLDTRLWQVEYQNAPACVYDSEEDALKNEGELTA